MVYSISASSHLCIKEMLTNCYRMPSKSITPIISSTLFCNTYSPYMMHITKHKNVHHKTCVNQLLWQYWAKLYEADTMMGETGQITIPP